MVKLITGLILVIVGVLAGLYVGGWVCFVGGIVDVIEEIRSENLVALNIAVGIAKVLFAGLLGWISALVFILPGLHLAKTS